MCLWWPRSVPYTESFEAATGVSRSDTALVPNALSTPPAQNEEESLGPVYPTKLGGEHFRLACLTAVEDDDVPVHVDLETYSLDNCPSYEAVSYTWGGENADSSPRRPVYVGPYWDVTMQTENCWEMLRFVRPQKRGFRLVWVDAICINQNSRTERSIQVSKMTRIFSEAMQVIVYLGPDIATRLPPGKYPRRRRLHELGSGRSHHRPQETRESSQDDQEIASLNLQSLLERRYFSRLWVVQELLLSARTTVRIGEVDFWTNGASSSHWLEDSRGETSAAKEQNDPEHGQRDGIFPRNTAAPWLAHVSKGFLSGTAGHILPQIMALTSSTHCSDTRDQLFGVLGLLKQDENEPTLQADYSLSLQHVYIGLFARLLLRDHLWALLVHNQSSPADDGSNCLYRPSWMPDWRSKTALRSFWASVAISPWSPQPKDEWPQSMEVEYKQEYSRSPGSLPRVLTTYFSVRYTLEVLNCGEAQPSSNLKLERRTGAITGDMVRLLPIISQPVLMDSRHNESMHRFRMRHCGRLVILYSRYRLDKLVQINSDDIYLVDQFRSRDWPGYLILRRLSPGQSPSARKERFFIACCEIVLFNIGSTVRVNIGTNTKMLSNTKMWSCKLSDCTDDELRGQLARGPFAYSLPTALTHAKAFNELFRSNMPTKAIHSLIFFGVNEPQRALAVYQALLDEVLPGILCSPARNFKNAYHSSFDPTLCPAVGEEHLGLVLPTEDLWLLYDPKLPGKSFPGRLRRYQLNNTEDTPILFQAYVVNQVPKDQMIDLQHEPAWAQPEKGSKWRVILYLRHVREHIMNSKEMELVYLLRQVSRQTGISEEELLEKDPHDMDSRVLVPACPISQTLVNDAGCDAVLDKISIV